MMKTHMQISLAVLALLTLASAVTAGLADWEARYGYSEPSYDRAYSAQRITDDGYILAGSTHDSYFSPAGAVTDVYLVKTDKAGNVTWDKTFGEADIYEQAYEVKQTLDEGYIVVGTTRETLVSNDPKVYLTKIDASGTKEPGWPKIFGSELSSDVGESVLQTSDGGYIIAGHTSAGGDPNIYIIKTDTNGVESWSKSFGGSGVDRAFSINYADDGYIITGQTTSSYDSVNIDVILLKIAGDGKLLWLQTFGGDGHDTGESVMQTADGGYIIVGEKGIYDAQDGKYRPDVYLIKTDPNGVEMWSKTFGGSGYDRAYSVRQTMDGGYIVGGHSSSFGAVSQNAYLIKTDSDGNLLWENALMQNNLHHAYSVEELDDGSYMIAGYTYSQATKHDFYLAQYTPDISKPNTTPIADSGSDITVYAGVDGAATITLDGSGSFDADGDELEYLWYEDANQIAAGVDPNVTFTVGEHVIDLIVDDGTVSSEPNSVLVTVIKAIEATRAYVVPRVINTTSRGRYVISLMQLPAGVSKDDIEAGSMTLDINGATVESVIERSVGSGSRNYIFAFFKRSEVIAQVAGNGSCDVTITGKLTTGQCIYGNDTIRVVQSNGNAYGSENGRRSRPTRRSSRSRPTRR
jgi:hypothetical protein